MIAVVLIRGVRHVAIGVDATALARLADDDALLVATDVVDAVSGEACDVFLLGPSAPREVALAPPRPIRLRIDAPHRLARRGQQV